MVGQLINPLPYRVTLDLSQSLASFLTDLHRQFVDSNERAFIPLAQIQTQLESRLASGPFDSLLVFENYPVGIEQSTDAPQAVCRHLYSVSQNNYPLTLVVVPGEELALTLKYSPEYFDEDGLNEVLNVYKGILQEFTRSLNHNASLPMLGEIPLFEQNELDLVQSYYYGESLDRGEHQDFVSRFKSVVTQYSERAAIVELEASSSVLSYGELDKLSNQFCHFLIEEGLRVNDRIGILLSNSQEFVISMLGCLKAGCSFLPLNTEAPAARVARVIEQGLLNAVVTDSEYFEKIASHELDLIIDLQQDNELILSSPTHSVDIDIVPELCAYTISTSGSTGEPKGVNVSHGALLNYIDAIELRLDLPEIASIGALATNAADLSYTAMFGALGSGRTLRIISDDKKLDSQALADELLSRPVSCLKIVPSHLAALLTIANPRRVLPTHCLILGGEAPRAELLMNIGKIAPQLKVVNHYGPTETTVGIASHEYQELGQATNMYSVQCVGRPLANNHCYILNDNLQSVGFGIEADLYLAGSQVSQGYYNQAALTADAFLPDPFSATPGARMYRSGDRARFLPNGDLVFAGRRDQQTKIRGYRIELGDIESCLLQYEAIQHAAVKCVDINQRQQLVAYLVGKSEEESQIKEYLVTSLPDYMQPKLFVWLHELPLTSNGKLDRNALPRPILENREIELPSTDLQHEIAAIWKEFLGVDCLSMRDNFFDLGGDSLMLMRIHRRICDEVSDSVKITDMFKFSTIAQLADFIASESSRSAPDVSDQVYEKMQASRAESAAPVKPRAERLDRRKRNYEGRKAKARSGRKAKTSTSDVG